jgi:hypothetical protein
VVKLPLWVATPLKGALSTTRWPEPPKNKPVFLVWFGDGARVPDTEPKKVPAGMFIAPFWWPPFAVLPGAAPPTWHELLQSAHAVGAATPRAMTGAATHTATNLMVLFMEIPFDSAPMMIANGSPAHRLCEVFG